MACSNNHDNCYENNNGCNGYLIIIVLYILLAIMLGSWLSY